MNRRKQIDYSKITKVFKDQKKPDDNIPFTDDIFPPNFNSILGKNKSGEYIDPIEGPLREKIFDENEIEWKRASDIFPSYLLFENKIDIEDIIQGKIGNCYFLSSLAALCEFPTLISQIFLSKEIPNNNCYTVILFIDGEYQKVYLDDYFPCVKGSNLLYFAKPNSFELWAILLEKAWAKINGGYANIISGWPCDVFRAFTGFGCEKLIHFDDKIDRIWGIIKTVDENNGVICTSTKNDPKIESKGLIKNHTYTLIDTEEVKDKRGKIIRLCKLRNPWGYKSWNGDWNKDSKLWTDDIRNQIGEEYLKEEEGTFFMSIEDIVKYFIRTDICQIIYGANVQIYNFNQNELNHPKVLNIYVKEEGILSISAIEKNWRYNRELRDISHPTSLIFAEYDVNEKKIKHAFCDFESYNDVEKTRFVKQGYYIVWIYKPLEICKEPKPEFLTVKISCNSEFSSQFVCDDQDFKIISEIIVQGVKHHRKNDLKDNDIFYQVKNSFNRSGIAYRIAINPLNNIYQEWENNVSKVEGITLILPNYKTIEKDKFTNNLGPNDYLVILGIQNDLYGTHWFNIKSDVKQYQIDEGKSPIEKKPLDFDSFCKKNVNKIKPKYNYYVSSFDILKNVEVYKVIDYLKILEEKFKEKYPVLMESILKLKVREEDKERKLGWVEINNNNGLYIGESDYAVKQGRGGYIFLDDNSKWIGYWDDNKKGNFGYLFSGENKLIYEGEYKNGKRNGQGTYYYDSGEKYIGEWKDGLREGKGIFYWDDGTYWEGNFTNNEMNGKGNYFDGEDSFPAEYRNGEFIEE